MKQIRKVGHLLWRKISLLFDVPKVPPKRTYQYGRPTCTTAEDIDALAAYNRRNLCGQTRPIAEIDEENLRLIEEIGNTTKPHTKRFWQTWPFQVVAVIVLFILVFLCDEILF